ncbi:MAG: L,D-transpeptidase [Deltaproteobacteria bacterium]|nr:L,D-transpeptidase [Myxococcales bacterium]MDP3213554.1 L,D-transpeptidase [Deltaproteobacteria bacterium]
MRIGRAESLRWGLAVALLCARGAHSQVPPRRLPVSGPVVAEALSAGAAADRSDGTVLPAAARSLRIEREGEVVRSRADIESARRGTLARGARLAVHEATQGRGCRSAWIRIDVDAWVCADGATLTADGPRAVAQPVVREGEVVPYQYAFATHAGVRTYRRMEDVAEENWAEELERGMSVAVVGTARIDGSTYVHTASGRWVSMRDLSFARPSERVGIFYEPGESVSSVGFFRANTRAWPTAESALRDSGPSGSSVAFTRREVAHVREERVLRGIRFARLDGGWVRASVLMRPAVGAVPAGLGGRERWVDIDRATQVLVALEGSTPVFATLVSTGRGEHPTRAGEHRVWSKLATTDMSNAGDADIMTATALYTAARVPWVMFFHEDQGLHGVFWHDLFGRPRSHGCVNMAPRDAAWLFQWAPPALPPGWTAVLPTAADPGLRVRVR